MKSIKLLIFLFIASIIGVNFQSCTPANTPDNNKVETANSKAEVASPNVDATSPKAETTSSKVETTSPTEKETAKETSTKPASEPENVETKKEKKSPVDPDIQFIRDKYAIITNAKNYKVESMKVECDQGTSNIERKSDENGELRYLMESSCGEHGCVTTHHYFWDKELIFIHRQNSYWAGNSDYMKEHRTYFKNNKMFQCLEKDISTTKGHEELMKKLKKTSNTTIDCTPDKRTANLQELIDLDLKKAKDFFCS